MIPLGHRIYPVSELTRRKSRGTTACPRRRVVTETAYAQARLDPADTVKARLPESQCPKRNTYVVGRTAGSLSRLGNAEPQRFEDLTPALTPPKGKTMKRHADIPSTRHIVQVPGRTAGVRGRPYTLQGCGSPIAIPRTQTGHLNRPERQSHREREIS